MNKEEIYEEIYQNISNQQYHNGRKMEQAIQIVDLGIENELDLK